VKPLFDPAGAAMLLGLWIFFTAILVLPVWFLIGGIFYPHVHPDLEPKWVDYAAPPASGLVSALVLFVLKRRADRRWK
jgi:hypothetical protein